MKKNLYILLIFWTIVIILSIIWNIFQLKKDNDKIVYRSAKSFFELIVLTRRWNAIHGGIYAPLNEINKPNPFLKKINIKLRDININDNITLTLINPAYMTRQLSELAKTNKDVQFRITSLKPINPNNYPTKYEEIALKEFIKGKKEFLKKIDNKFFYMAPLKVERPCLKCHNTQGYKIGDIIGGISVIVPYTCIIPYKSLLIGHSLIWIIGFIFIIIYNNKLKEAYEKIKKQAMYDGLTGILNRREFQKRIKAEFNRGKRYKSPLSIIMCDIDFFKKYNDTYGHQMGDEVLKKVASTIKETIKRAGDFCARYGGEEFIIVLPNTDIEGAIKIAKEIQEKIEKLNIIHNNSTIGKLTLSMGIYTEVKFNQNNYEDLIQKADLSLYKAKEKGRNRIEIFKNEPNKTI